MRRAVILAGATATGKTDLGEDLAAALGGEIVCADARQVFAELEIGTGKPTPAQRDALPHHLFDALALGERASAGEWARRARATCEALFARGVVPVLVGGSGLYLRALLEGLHAEPPHDAAIRERLRAEWESEGAAAMHARLAASDPATAARLAPRDRQRILRALEVEAASGRPLSAWHAAPTREALAADWRIAELVCDPEQLAARIDTRTRAMFAGGLLEETRALLDAGKGPALAALRAIGYDEAMACLAGTCDRAEAEAATSLRTRQLAKRQRTWFRHQLAAVRVDPGARTGREGLAALRAALDA